MKKLLALMTAFIFVLFNSFPVDAIGVSVSSRPSVSVSVSRPVSTPSVSRPISTPTVTPKPAVTTSAPASKPAVTTTKVTTNTTKSTTPPVKSGTQTLNKGNTIKPQTSKTGYKSGASVGFKSYPPYMVTNTGSYLMLTGYESDGDPIYYDAYTGEEVDDDDLESLGAQPVDSIPNKSVQEAPVVQTVNAPIEQSSQGVGAGLFIVLSMMIVSAAMAIGYFGFGIGKSKS